MFLEMHCLKSFPLGRMNTNQNGQLKKIYIGDNVRQRISSQCIKRNIRFSFRNSNGSIRSTQFVKLCAEKAGVSEAIAANFLSKISCIDIKTIKDKNKNIIQYDLTTGLYISDKEIDFAVECLKSNEKDSHKRFESYLRSGKGLSDDIRLFGRMSAHDRNVNVLSSSSFSHWISCNDMYKEIDLFTAVDDLTGACFMLGERDLSANIFYGYAVVNISQFLQAGGFIESLLSLVRLFPAVYPDGGLSGSAHFSLADFYAVSLSRKQPVNLSSAFAKSGEGIELAEHEAKFWGKVNDYQRMYSFLDERKFFYMSSGDSIASESAIRLDSLDGIVLKSKEVIDYVLSGV